jgi:quercetin dioxygenase-like cupin family protein
MALYGKLPHINRFITTHDPKTGKAIFSTAFPEPAPFARITPNDSPLFAQAFVTDNGFPVSLQNDADLKTYASYLDKSPGITVSGGSVLRFVDMAPGLTSPMHRTVSLDYGVVLEGEIALVLDSGEEKIMRRGDVAIQRGTMHAWRNCSQTEWCRMMYVLLPSTPATTGEGKELLEDYGDMEGVRKST